MPHHRSLSLDAGTKVELNRLGDDWKTSDAATLIKHYEKLFNTGALGGETLHRLITALVISYRSRLKLAVNSMEHATELDIFSCPSCFGFLRLPVTVCCGHTYCKDCLQRNELKYCKICLKRFGSMAKVSSNVVLQGLLERLFPLNCKAIKLNDEGNHFFRQKDFASAVDKYTEALDLVSGEHLIYSNKSQAYSCLKKYDSALADALEAIRLQPDWAKNYLRKGKALRGLGRVEDAVQAYLHCLALDNTLPAARLALNEVITDLYTRSPQDARIYLLSLIAGSGDVRLRKISGGSRAGGHVETSSHDGMKVCWVHTQPVDVSKLMSADLECPLCFRLLLQPVATPCGHVFCRMCLDRNLDHRPSCPICKYALNQYLSEHRKDVVEVLNLFIAKYMSDELSERQKEYEHELRSLSGTVPGTHIRIFVCTAAYPTIPCPLHVFEPRYRLMMRECYESQSQTFGMCMPTYNQEETFTDCGTLLHIRHVEVLADGRSLVDTVGVRRFTVLYRSVREAYNTAQIELIEDELITAENVEEVKEVHDRVYEIARDFINSLDSVRQARLVNHFGEMPEKPEDLTECGVDGPSWVWYILAILPLDTDATCLFLKERSLTTRCDMLLDKIEECRGLMAGS